MSAARVAQALANHRQLYGRTPPEYVADIRRGVAELQRLLDEADRPVDLGAVLDQLARQAGGIAQTASRGAAAARALAAQVHGE